MRNIVSTWLRKGEVIRTISYSKIDNALSRMTFHALQKGQPGDVMELSHRYTGLHIGTVKIRVNKIETNYIWDSK